MKKNWTKVQTQARPFPRYVYNAIGNIDNKCGTAFTYGNSMHPSAVTFNPATNKSYTYDNNGNMLTRSTPTVSQTLTYDIDNRVISVTTAGSSTNMEYDYTGMRVKKNAPTGITLFPFQGYEIAPSGEITKFIKIGVETFASKRGTNKFFYHNDHLGSVNVITDSGGVRCEIIEYDPWGSVSRSEGPTPGTQPICDPTHRFNGKELDPETGLYYYGGRYYDPEISRFVSADPFIQGPANPQNLNRYSYVSNDPQNYIDPSGYHHLRRLDKMMERHLLGPFLGGFFGAIVTVVVPPLLTAYAGFSQAAANVAGAGLGSITTAVISGKNPAAGIAMVLLAALSKVDFSQIGEVFTTLGGSNTLAATSSGGVSSGAGAGARSTGGSDFSNPGFGGLTLVAALGGSRRTNNSIRAEANRIIAEASPAERGVGATIYGEAGGQSWEDKLGVGWSMRTRHDLRPGIGYEEMASAWYAPRYQLRSGTRINLELELGALKDSLAAARQVLGSNAASNPIPGVTHFHDVSIAYPLSQWGKGTEVTGYGSGNIRWYKDVKW